MNMSVEWIAQTDLLKCTNCGDNINKGEVVVGELDEFFHKDAKDCE